MSSPRLLSNRYELEDTLGYGGMSEVHRGRDIRLGRDVAVKVLRADLANDPTFQLRFRREAQNAAALNHPAIVAVYDTGETDSENGPLPYIVMEYVEGRTLRDIVKTEGPLNPRRAMEVMADATAALDFSHKHDIVHRDVKPANIMITESGAVKVMDFGIARALAGEQAAVTQTAAVIGTAQYLSPEQARGEAVDARSDVYSAGCVLFELLTGEPPFTGDSPVAVAYQHVREQPRKPSDLNQSVPPPLDAVVLKALSKNPENRYDSAADMRSDLVRVLSGQRPNAPLVMSDEERTAMFADADPEPEHTAAQEPVPPEEVADGEHRRKRRKGWLIALTTAACVAVLALVGWFAATTLTSDEPERIAVPKFEGRAKGEAVNLANQRNWQLNQTDCYSSPQQINRVIKQDPSPGAQVVKANTTVTICSGVGPKKVPVPDLTGLSMDQAAQKLQGQGLKMGYNPEYRETEDPNLVDKVVDWNNRGSEVNTGTTIQVTIGTEPQTQEVPDVQGQPFDTAKAYLEGAGFKVVRQDREADQSQGTVIEQSPSGGSQARPGEQVTLHVSTGKKITMPQVRGSSPEEVEQQLRSQGWQGDINEQNRKTGNEDMDGKVIGSSPSSGQKLDKNQSVTLHVGDYDESATGTSSDQPPSGIFPFD
ncbi:Stk1 family PASTA domain-containing Ser/Thr kinase [Salinifilum ghardaiensis]